NPFSLVPRLRCSASGEGSGSAAGEGQAGTRTRQRGTVVRVVRVVREGALLEEWQGVTYSDTADKPAKLVRGVRVPPLSPGSAGALAAGEPRSEGAVIQGTSAPWLSASGQQGGIRASASPSVRADPGVVQRF